MNTFTKDEILDFAGPMQFGVALEQLERPTHNIKCHGCKYCDNCHYCERCSECYNCSNSIDCKLCDNCSNCNSCNDSDNCSECDGCSNCWNCVNCFNCAYCKCLHNATYCILNVQFTKEEYEKIMESLTSK